MGPLNPSCFDCFPLACPVLASFSTSFSTYAFPFQIPCLNGPRFLPDWHKFFWLIAATYMFCSLATSRDMAECGPAAQMDSRVATARHCFLHSASWYVHLDFIFVINHQQLRVDCQVPGRYFQVLREHRSNRHRLLSTMLFPTRHDRLLQNL